MRWWLAVGVLLTLGAVQAGTLVGGAGAFEVEVAVHPDPPEIGENHVTVTVRHRGERVVNATVEVSAKAGEHSAEAEAKATDEPGVYAAALSLPAAAKYRLIVDVAAGSTHGQAGFALATGNPVWQPAPSDVRKFWFGLVAILLALAIIRFLPLWPEHHERKAVLAAAVLLIGAWLVARHAVSTWRRPGQMDVIEAQAMDMAAMKPPIGVVPVQVEQAGFGEFGATVTYTGSVVPYNEQAVRARVTGWIVSMPAYPGDSVAAGTVLAQLDSRELDARARQAIAESSAAMDAAAAARSDAVKQTRRIDELRAAANAADARVAESRSMRDEAAAALVRAKSDRERAAAMVTEAERQVAAAEASQRSAKAMSQAAKSEVDLAGAEREQATATVDQAKQAREAAQRQVAAAQRELAARQAAVEQAEAQAAATRQMVPQAEAEVAAAKANVDYWTPEMARMKSLLGQGAVSREEFDKEQSQADEAKASLQRAQARVTQAKSDVAAAEAMVKQATAGVGAAQEMVAARQAEAQAAVGRVAEAEASVRARQAQVGRQSSAATSQTAMVDEAAETIAMRRAQLARAQAEVKAADAAIREATQRVAARDAGINQAQADADAARKAIPTAQAEAAAAAQRAGAAGMDIAAKQAAASAESTVLSYTTIRAELDGVVTERTVSPPTLVQPGDIILRLAQIDRVRLQANVASEDARRIKVGARVRVTTPKAGDRDDVAVVTSVFPAADPKNRTAVVEAVVDNPDRFYLPGDPITMEIASGGEVQVITVPREAINHRVAEAGAVTGEVRPVVWTVRGGGAGKTEYFCTMHPQIVQDEPGLCPICKMDLTPRQVAGGGGGEAQREWYCTMHPQIVQDHPGICPICKMDLTPRTIGGAGGEIAHQVPVTLGDSSAGRVEVLSGLKPGDRVIVAGLEYLREGDRVRVVDSLGPAPALGDVVHADGSSGGTGDMPGMSH